MNQPFQPNGNTYVVAPTNTSARSRINGGSGIRITNYGTVNCFLKFGGSAVVAVAATDMIIPPGQTELFLIPGQCEFVAYITAAGTGALNMTTGEGI